MINSDQTEPIFYTSTPERPLIPRRYVVCFLCFMATLIEYSFRVNLSFAIIPMAKSQNWDDTTKGIVLSSFFWGYITMQVPGGWLSARYGGKLVLALSMFWASLFVWTTPFFINYFPLLVASRVITGLGEAMTYPCIHALIAAWVPEDERAVSIGFIWGGAYVGTMIGYVLSPIIIETLGWDYAFYLFAYAGFLWLIPWFFFTASSPQDIKNNLVFRAVHFSELQESSTSPSLREDKTSTVPFGALLSSMPVWSVIVANFSSNWGFYVLLTWSPTFIKEKLKFDLTKSGFLSILPFLAMFIVSTVVGKLADTIMTKKILSKAVTRRLSQSLAAFGAALFLLLLSYTTNGNPSLAIVYLTCALGMQGFLCAGYAAGIIDISLNFASVIYGMANTAGTIPGIVGVYMTGAILTKTGSWSLVFDIAAGVYIFGGVFWLVFSTSKRLWP